MRGKSRLPAQWVLPILTIGLVLLAIVLPERISALRDRKLFAAAHVEAFDSQQGVAAPDMTLAQRVNTFAALNYGEVTDAYSRIQDRFTEEELEHMDALGQSAVDELVSAGVFSMPYGVSVGKMERYDCSMGLIWDRVTEAEASLLYVSYYDDPSNFGMNLVLDEESGLAVQVSVFYPELETEFAGTDGARLADTLCLFANQFDGEVSDIKYGKNDAYLTIRTEDGDICYHAGQKYDVMVIEPSPSAVPADYAAFGADAVQYSVENGAEIYDADLAVNIK